MKHDIQLQQEVLAELDHEDKIPPGSVGVEVHHGVVKLAGVAPDTAAKEKAAHAAERVEGVTEIIVDIDVGQRRRSV